eukprot:TRINITY_DN7064_c0_g1_i1.p1 TRINITY_DN7064_c0_g1~~TRINITY_DN7064_c0_g1_i1.p1  ORF type:complete len:310 (+),score=79.54 TRINITY_DN7064_c0_g1_i1:15-944(+)
MANKKPSTGSLELRVTINQATGLPVADSNGKSDPYAIFKIAKYSEKTKTISKTLNPVWNHDLSVYLDPKPSRKTEPQEDIAFIEVYDSDMFSRDDLLGTTSFNIALLHPNTPKAEWYNLNKPNGSPAGRIQVTLTAVNWGTKEAPKPTPLPAGPAYGSQMPPQGGNPYPNPQAYGSQMPPQGAYGSQMPPQGGYPPQGAYGSQMPPQGAYPPQGYGSQMPPQGMAPFGAWGAPQGGYNPYPPQQGGYNPYPPQQGGYNPYPPQQGGYSPYPPQQGGYPPQQQSPYGAQSGYPPAQNAMGSQYPPGQGPK